MCAKRKLSPRFECADELVTAVMLDPLVVVMNAEICGFSCVRNKFVFYECVYIAALIV
jgi:hypothetical protein